MFYVIAFGFAGFSSFSGFCDPQLKKIWNHGLGHRRLALRRRLSAGIRMKKYSCHFDTRKMNFQNENHECSCLNKFPKRCNMKTWSFSVNLKKICLKVKRSFQKGKMKKFMCFPPVSFFHLASFFESGLNLKVLFFNSGHLVPHESSFVCISQRRTFRNHAFQCRKPGHFHFSGFLYFALFSALTIWSNDVKWCQIWQCNFSTCTVGFPNNHSSKW